MDLLEPPEAFDAKKVEEGVRLILEDRRDPARAGLRETPARVARMYEEIFAGIGKDASQVVTVVEGADHDEMIMVRDIPLQSFCEHHLILLRHAHVAYIPNKAQQITGLSKIARSSTCSKRPQVQERLTTEIAEAIDRAPPRGVFVVIEAEHLCMTIWIKKPGAVTVTTVRAVPLRRPTRQEAMDHIAMHRALGGPAPPGAWTRARRRDRAVPPPDPRDGDRERDPRFVQRRDPLRRRGGREARTPAARGGRGPGRRRR